MQSRCERLTPQEDVSTGRNEPPAINQDRYEGIRLPGAGEPAHSVNFTPTFGFSIQCCPCELCGDPCTAVSTPELVGMTLIIDHTYQSPSPFLDTRQSPGRRTVMNSTER